MPTRLVVAIAFFALVASAERPERQLSKLEDRVDSLQIEVDELRTKLKRLQSDVDMMKLH